MTDRGRSDVDAAAHDDDVDTQLDRRRFIAGAVALTATVAAGCSDGSDRSAPKKPAGSSGTSTDPTAARAAWKLSDIDHVVIFMQENRTFDEYFGRRKGVRGFADPHVMTLPDGKPIWYQPNTGHPDGYILPFPVKSLTTAGQALLGCDHSWQGMHGAWNAGKMDKFAEINGAFAMPAYGRADLPYYWALADRFTLCDHFYCSVLGPTLPNRHMSMTGSIDPAGAHGGPATDNSGSGYRWETYPERLEKGGVSWRIYHETDDYDDNAVKYYQHFMDAKPGDALYDRSMANLAPDTFEQDVASGNLPQVSWIVAPTALSEHPPYLPASGEDYTSRKIGALLAHPKVWAKTLFILTYDESDGAFDHVRPPVPDPDTPGEFVTVGSTRAPVGLGMRVPTLLISPFASGGQVVSETLDHTSVLRLLETRFGVEVPYLSDWRRETCGDLATVLDTTHRPDPSVPPLPDTVEHLAKVSDAVRSHPIASAPTDQELPPVEE